MPAAQAAQRLAPLSAAAFPASHGEQRLWPVADWALPGSQLAHSVSPEAFCAFPELQAVHDEAPDDAPKCPCAHSVQLGDPGEEYFPEAQSEQDTDSAGEKVPAAQAVQVVAPVAEDV